MGDQLRGHVQRVDTLDGPGHGGKQGSVLSLPIRHRHDWCDCDAHWIASESHGAQRGQALLDPRGAPFEVASDGRGVDREPYPRAPAMIQLAEGFDSVELCGPAELYRRIPLAEKANGRFQTARKMFDPERVGVAGGFERCTFSGSVARLGGHLALAGIRPKTFQYLRQIGVSTCDGRTAQRSRKITVLAVRRAALRDVELPVSRRWNRL